MPGMESEPWHARAIAAGDGTPHVLLVTAAREPAAWAQADGHRFDVHIAPDIASARRLLSTASFDVVIMDATSAAAPSGELQGLRNDLGDAELIVLAPDSGADGRPDGARVLPADAPVDVQAQIVALAAERARLAATLARRTAELEESRSHFRDVIERNADAIVVVDGEGTIRFANSVAAELFRTPRDALTGTAFGFPVTAGETTELDLLHPDGAHVVEMRVVDSEWDGQPAYIASLRDTTERRRAEESARRLIREQTARSSAESAARRFRFQADASTRLSEAADYAAMLSTLATLCADEIADWVVIFIVDQEGAVRRVETAHCDARHAREVEHLREFAIAAGDRHPVLEVLRTQTPVLVTHADDAHLTRMATDRREAELIRRLGVASYMIVPLIARGRALGAMKLVSSHAGRHFTVDDLAIASDLALRAALALDNAWLYRQAQEANHAKTDLLAVISHDLRTPLNAIIGYAELLTLGLPDPLTEGSARHVERIGNSARHLLYLIDELSSFARLEAGRTELKLRTVDARDIAQEVNAVVQPLAADRELQFELRLPDTPLMLHTDPDRLRQILLNLTGNAVKYTEQGKVTLAAAYAADGGVVFRVTDTGIGIREDHLSRIFEPFWQAEPTQRLSSGGTGLGLSIVRRLVTMLGGVITVSSTLGAGSTFTARFPPE